MYYGQTQKKKERRANLKSKALEQRADSNMVKLGYKEGISPIVGMAIRDEMGARIYESMKKQGYSNADIYLALI